MFLRLRIFGVACKGVEIQVPYFVCLFLVKEPLQGMGCRAPPPSQALLIPPCLRASSPASLACLVARLLVWVFLLLRVCVACLLALLACLLVCFAAGLREKERGGQLIGSFRDRQGKPNQAVRISSMLGNNSKT